MAHTARQSIRGYSALCMSSRSHAQASGAASWYGLSLLCPPQGRASVPLGHAWQLWQLLTEKAPLGDLTATSHRTLDVSVVHQHARCLLDLFAIESREGGVSLLTRRPTATLMVSHVADQSPNLDRAHLVAALQHGLLIPRLLLRRSEHHRGVAIAFEECVELLSATGPPSPPAAPVLHSPPSLAPPNIATPAAQFIVKLCEDILQDAIQSHWLRPVAAPRGARRPHRQPPTVSSRFGLDSFELCPSSAGGSAAPVTDVLSWGCWTATNTGPIRAAAGAAPCRGEMIDSAADPLVAATVDRLRRTATAKASVLTAAAHGRLQGMSAEELRELARCLVTCLIGGWPDTAAARAAAPQTSLRLDPSAQLELLSHTEDCLRRAVGSRPRGVPLAELSATIEWPTMRRLMGGGATQTLMLTDYLHCEGYVVDRATSTVTARLPPRTDGVDRASRRRQRCAFLRIGDGPPCPAATSDESRYPAELAMLFDLLDDAQLIPPLLTELSTVVLLSLNLRRRIQKARRQHQHQLRHKRGAVAAEDPYSGVAGGDAKKVLEHMESETFERYVRSAVSLPGKLAGAHPKANSLVSVYLLLKWGLADGLQLSPGIATLEDVSTMWERQWAAQLVIPSPKVIETALLLDRLATTTSASRPPSEDDIRTVWEVVLQPFLYRLWGVQGVAAADITPQCTTHAFLQHVAGAIQAGTAIRWSQLESYLQLSRLRPETAQEAVRVRLREHLSGDAAQCFVLHDDGAAVVPGSRLMAYAEDLRSTLELPEDATGSTKGLEGLGSGSVIAPPSMAAPIGPAVAGAASLMGYRPFAEMLAAAQADPRPERLTNFVQSAMRVLFHAVVPHLRPCVSGRRFAYLSERLRWHRHGPTLGSLDSFLVAFEDVLFTIDRGLTEKGGGAAAAVAVEGDAVHSRRDDTASALLPLSPHTIISLHHGPVGPWLLYGRLISRLFPTHRSIPLGAMAESLSWGLFFTPRLGDLPSLLRRVGREVRAGVLLPLPDTTSRPAPCTVLSREAQWWCVLTDMMAAREPLPEDPAGCVQFVEDDLRRGLEAAGRTADDWLVLVRDMTSQSPLLFQWTHDDSLQVRLRVPDTCCDGAALLVETYIFPHLRQSVPITATDLQEYVQWGQVWSPAWRASGLGTSDGTAMGLSMLAALWVNTSVQGTTLWQCNGALRHGSDGFITRHGPTASIHVIPRTSDGNTVVLVSPAAPWVGVQDQLLSLNGLRVLPRHAQEGDGPATAGVDKCCLVQWASTAPTLLPSEKPVSLFEVVAEWRALTDTAARNAAALKQPLKPSSEEVKTKVAWLPESDGGVGDIMVWVP